MQGVETWSHCWEPGFNRYPRMLLAMIRADIPLVALQITVRGIVQGVGFRPFVYRLAQRFALSGTVANNGNGVHICIAGPVETLDRFIAALQAEAPPIARIIHLDVLPLTRSLQETGFSIIASDSAIKPSTQIAPDIAICPDCLAEILDPADRRFGYPFTNCTNCGPRFTIVNRIPYDRPNTSMRVFAMCADCNREYHDPFDRRFHAQPNACPVCGPSLSWHDQSGLHIAGDCLEQAALQLSLGKVVAIKGLGGFHLVVDANNTAAVAELRQRKHRPGKPLAVMVRDLAAAEALCRISDQEAALLTSPEHPIVLLEQRSKGCLAQGVAPGLQVLGVMLPYTPLHALLFDQAQAPSTLVMTSGNRSDEPICTKNDEALRRLGTIADYFLLHNREIVTRVDDSVVRVMAGKPRMLRRARGFSPIPLQLNRPTADVLACGAAMKNSVCLVRNQEAYISQHIGELTSPQSYDFFVESIEHLQNVLETVPARVACDQHPDYQSTRYADARRVPCVRVQHHHAHVGAVMAEQGLDGPVLGVILDGTGYGTDGTVFGGEIYRADRTGFTRLGRLGHLLLPGGDKAALEPWRMAMALVFAMKSSGYPVVAFWPAALDAIESETRAFVWQMLEKRINAPQTSSCGRLFDAVSALLGLCLVSEYEGQAAMLLEQQAMNADGQLEGGYQVKVDSEDGMLVIDSTALGAALLQESAAKVPVAAIALHFHRWLVDAIATVLKLLRQQTGLGQVVLSGGCMQNKLLFESLVHQLEHQGFAVFAGEMVPMNDGGIALGQAFIGGNPCV